MQEQAEARRRMTRQWRTIGMITGERPVSSMTDVQDIEIQAQSPQPRRGTSKVRDHYT